MLQQIGLTKIAIGLGLVILIVLGLYFSARRSGEVAVTTGQNQPQGEPPAGPPPPPPSPSAPKTSPASGGTIAPKPSKTTPKTPVVMTPEQEKALRDSQRILSATTIRVALEKYFLANKMYPKNVFETSPNYLAVFPRDPIDNENFFYARCSETSYHFGVNLEWGDASLASDSDSGYLCSIDVISGKDDLGCHGESGRKCLDFVVK